MDSGPVNHFFSTPLFPHHQAFMSFRFRRQDGFLVEMGVPKVLGTRVPAPIIFIEDLAFRLGRRIVPAS